MYRLVYVEIKYVFTHCLYVVIWFKKVCDFSSSFVSADFLTGLLPGFSDNFLSFLESPFKRKTIQM